MLLVAGGEHQLALIASRDSSSFGMNLPLLMSGGHTDVIPSHQGVIRIEKLHLELPTLRFPAVCCQVTLSSPEC